MQSNQSCGNATESTTILLTYTVSRYCTFFSFANCKLRMYGSFAILRDLVRLYVKKRNKVLVFVAVTLENGLSWLGP